jgi:hypothetical protein
MNDLREFLRQYNNYLMHYGIKGMHWGIRRYQNPDGSLTELGKKRYAEEEKLIKAQYHDRNEVLNKQLERLNNKEKLSKFNEEQKKQIALELEVNKRMVEKELDKLKNTPIKDISTRKADARVKAVLATIGGTAIGQFGRVALGLHYGPLVIFGPNDQLTTSEERADIIDNAQKDYGYNLSGWRSSNLYGGYTSRRRWNMPSVLKQY